MIFRPIEIERMQMVSTKNARIYGNSEVLKRRRTKRV